MRRRAVLVAAAFAVAIAACSGGGGGDDTHRAASSRTRHRPATTTTKPSVTTTAAATTTVASTAAPVPPTTTPRRSTPAPTATPPATAAPVVRAPSGPGASIDGCSVFPSDNAWNQDVSTLPVHPNSAAYIASINASRTTLHADFGGGGEYGIPFVVVADSETPRVVNWTAYGDESDPGPYPIPPDAPVEGGADSDGDRHVLALQRGTCRLFELYRAFWQGDHWDADSGAVWDLRSNALRPHGWTSADAAGLPILPGLVRYDEVAAGAVHHALRFTVQRTQRGYILPATHLASSSNDASLPPMGLRLRLRADFDLSPYQGEARVILEALKHYGMIVADNGSSWYITGAADARWNDDDLNQLKRVPGSAFEAVDTGPIQH